MQRERTKRVENVGGVKVRWSQSKDNEVRGSSDVIYLILPFPPFDANFVYPSSSTSLSSPST